MLSSDHLLLWSALQLPNGSGQAIPYHALPLSLRKNDTIMGCLGNNDTRINPSRDG